MLLKSLVLPSCFPRAISDLVVMLFPSLVGGTLIKEDFAPSVVFAILYGSLIPLAAFRLLRKSSRTTLLIAPIAFTIERVVIFSLRATQSRDVAKAGSHGLASYEQLTIGMGYISISQGLSSFLRVLLVNTTKHDPSDESPNAKTFDQPRRRHLYRRIAGILDLSFISSIVPGTIAGTRFANSINDPVAARRTMRLRYASSGVALFLTVTMGIVSLVTARKIRRVPKAAVFILVTVCCLLSMVAIYRLVVMHNMVDSLLSREPGSLSSPTAKALFYIIHMVPEWLVALILLGPNNRRIFNTGPFGDWRGSDPKKQTDTNEIEGAENLRVLGTSRNADSHLRADSNDL